jgi:hypothetical protein
LRKREKTSRTQMWTDMPWKPVEQHEGDFAGLDDVSFMGLEEVDGNAYMASINARKAAIAELRIAEEAAEGAAEASTEELGASAAASNKKTKKRKAKQAEEVIDAEAEEESVVETKKAKKSKKGTEISPGAAVETAATSDEGRRRNSRALLRSLTLMIRDPLGMQSFSVDVYPKYFRYTKHAPPN